MRRLKPALLITLICAFFITPTLVLAQGQTGLAEGMNQLGRMTKLWQGMVFGPESFKKAIVPNPNAEPNTVTISAYTPALSNTEMIEIAMAKVHKKWGKRGDVGLYFPMGMQVEGGPKLHFVFGKDAEKYIKEGGLLRGFSTVGMPVDDFGSANFAKNIAMINTSYAFNQVSKSKVFRRAMTAIAKQKPELRAAAKAFDLSKPELVQALSQRAATDKALAKAMGTMTREMAQPMGFVVNAGFRDNDNGMLHYGMHKRPANEAMRPTRDKVVAKKVADLMFSWWMKVLPQAKTLQPKIFDANHCAGVYDSADWLFVLEAKLKKEKPKLVKEVMRRTYSYDLGAGANRPEGVRHIAQMGARDMFGHLNTPTSVMKKAKMKRASHMLNVELGALNPDGLPALEVKPFAAAFNLRLYDGPSTVKLPKRANALRRSKFLHRLASRYTGMAREQGRVHKDLHANSPKEDASWPTFKMADANVRGNKAIYEAKASRAKALSSYLVLKAKGITGPELGAARAKVKETRLAQRQAEKKMRQEIGRLGYGRNTLTDATQYQLYIHGGQATAHKKHLESKGPAAMKRYQRRAAAHGKVFQRQVVSFYGRARAAMETVRKSLGPKK